MLFQKQRASLQGFSSWGMKGDSSRQNSMEDNSQISSAFPKEPPLEFLKDITKDFSSEREVGHGAFGVVYKGILQTGQLVAVKKLVRTSGVHDRRFQNEVGNLQKLEHKNIVKLLGSCYQVERKLVERNGRRVLSDVPEKFLCYEHLSNGSLDNYIYDESSGLDWPMRFKVIMGICNGLHFLHEEGNEAIVHLNLKPSNILLGDNMVPKIADFGLSRLFGEEQTRILTQNVVGWIGYIAPEYHYRGEISVKSDIFSLGVLILEIVTGLKKDPNIQDISSKLFIDNVCKNWTKKSHVESKYKSLEEEYLLQVKRCIELGLKCVETDPNNRPTAGSIMDKLAEINYEASIHEFLEKKLQPITAFPREPKLQFIEDITRNFSKEQEIGRGSFGVIYKGTLQSGEIVAVKRLLVVSQTNQDKQFMNEVCSLIDLNHRNIVKLIGYCYEIRRKLVESHGRYVFADTTERLLCYEYLPRGSLDMYLYGTSHELNWDISFKIIQGICQGLRFLHELRRPIIHMDLKPGNILLDDNLMPKISDFGLSRLFGEEQTRTLTSNVVGSRYVKIGQKCPK
ncbi:cysteine-rich receptor-like protein kinase 44 isoform X3 [Phragmites australis]|uniref:cysteine-rich receptor-like protein kinase 44 isoform X3 n=1 Tax=Phragmites australis TaxID=29695 RepID=UPI002D7806E9|nr:cysteine-rich receptor-like protein kinase 44 isoform X3 [Phragmites australis]